MIMLCFQATVKVIAKEMKADFPFCIHTDLSRSSDFTENYSESKVMAHGEC